MKQNGKSVVVSTGAELSVVLDSNPTTGYVWAVPNFDPDLLRLKENKFIPDEKSGEIMVGVGGKRIFTFIALKKGETLLNTFRSRPWEKNKLISKFSLTVRVRD
jgi:inhibitor of cysteine peptidase